jgi:septum formation protein
MIYLASKSPRRAELLKQIGVAFELLLPEATEDAYTLHGLPITNFLQLWLAISDLG